MDQHSWETLRQAQSDNFFREILRGCIRYAQHMAYTEQSECAPEFIPLNLSFLFNWDDNFLWETLLQSVETDIHQNDNLPFLVILEESPIHWGDEVSPQEDRLMLSGDSSLRSRMTITFYFHVHLLNIPSRE